MVNQPDIVMIDKQQKIAAVIDGAIPNYRMATCMYNFPSFHLLCIVCLQFNLTWAESWKL